MPNRADLNVFTQIAANILNFDQKQYMCEDKIGEDFAS